MSCGKKHLVQSPSTSTFYPKHSLLKYEPLRLIVHDNITDHEYQQLCRATLSPCVEPASLYNRQLHLLDPYSNLCRPADILDFLFPPAEHFSANNHKYVR